MASKRRARGEEEEENSFVGKMGEEEKNCLSPLLSFSYGK